MATTLTPPRSPVQAPVTGQQGDPLSAAGNSPAGGAAAGANNGANNGATGAGAANAANGANGANGANTAAGGANATGNADFPPAPTRPADQASAATQANGTQAAGTKANVTTKPITTEAPPVNADQAADTNGNATNTADHTAANNAANNNGDNGGTGANHNGASTNANGPSNNAAAPAQWNALNGPGQGNGNGRGNNDGGGVFNTPVDNGLNPMMDTGAHNGAPMNDFNLSGGSRNAAINFVNTNGGFGATSADPFVTAGNDVARSLPNSAGSGDFGRSSNAAIAGGDPNNLTARSLSDNLSLARPQSAFSNSTGSVANRHATDASAGVSGNPAQRNAAGARDFAATQSHGQGVANGLNRSQPNAGSGPGAHGTQGPGRGPGPGQGPGPAQGQGVGHAQGRGANNPDFVPPGLRGAGARTAEGAAAARVLLGPNGQSPRADASQGFGRGNGNIGNGNGVRSGAEGLTGQQKVDNRLAPGLAGRNDAAAAGRLGTPAMARQWVTAGSVPATLSPSTAVGQAAIELADAVRNAAAAQGNRESTADAVKAALASAMTAANSLQGLLQSGGGSGRSAETPANLMLGMTTNGRNPAGAGMAAQSPGATAQLPATTAQSATSGSMPAGTANMATGGRAEQAETLAGAATLASRNTPLSAAGGTAAQGNANPLTGNAGKPGPGPQGPAGETAAGAQSGSNNTSFTATQAAMNSSRNPLSPLNTPSWSSPMGGEGRAQGAGAGQAAGQVSAEDISEAALAAAALQGRYWIPPEFNQPGLHRPGPRLKSEHSTNSFIQDDDLVHAISCLLVYESAGAIRRFAGYAAQHCELPEQDAALIQFGVEQVMYGWFGGEPPAVSRHDLFFLTDIEQFGEQCFDAMVAHSRGLAQDVRVGDPCMPSGWQAVLTVFDQALDGEQDSLRRIAERASLQLGQRIHAASGSGDYDELREAELEVEVCEALNESIRSTLKAIALACAQRSRMLMAMS